MKKQLHDIPPNKLRFMDKAAVVVGMHFNRLAGDLRSKKRTSELVEMRAYFTFLVLKFSKSENIHMVDIASYMDRDHSTLNNLIWHYSDKLNEKTLTQMFWDLSIPVAV